MNIQDAPISPKVKAFLSVLLYKTLKSKQKNDITIRISDPNTFLQPSLGFSVKSQIGKASTLVNASGATNFVYKIEGIVLTDAQIKAIDLLEEFSDKIKFIKSQGGQLEYEKLQSEIFETNLHIINYYFDTILAKILLHYYSADTNHENSIPKFIDKITDENPLKYKLDINPDMYRIAMKSFLKYYALGMRAGSIWKRVYEATGGYIIVRPDGELICYHFYFAKEFEEYLYHNTKLETPSTDKHHFGSIYSEDGQQKIKLNLQIRFIK